MHADEDEASPNLHTSPHTSFYISLHPRSLVLAISQTCLVILLKLALDTFGSDEESTVHWIEQMMRDTKMGQNPSPFSRLIIRVRFCDAVYSG